MAKNQSWSNKYRQPYYYAEFDNLNVTKFQGLQTVFEGRFENLTPFIQKMRVIKSADEIQKMIVAGDYADKAVNIGFRQYLS